MPQAGVEKLRMRISLQNRGLAQPVASLYVLQLEWWNAGILENWVLEYCNIGFVVRGTIPFKMNIIL